MAAVDLDKAHVQRTLDGASIGSERAIVAGLDVSDAAKVDAVVAETIQTFEAWTAPVSEVSARLWILIERSGIGT